jgi:class 3 adenylate cyclase
MNIADFFNRSNIIDLAFFNFRNAVTAAYFADADLRILKVNDNFRSFFPVLGNISGALFSDVLAQLGVEEKIIRSFSDDLAAKGRVLIPEIRITIDRKARVYSLLSTRTRDDNFHYLNGVQGQFVDRTAEFELRRERENLLEEKLRDREIIEAKTRQLEQLANRLAKYLSPQIYHSIFSGKSEIGQGFARKNLTIFFSDIQGFTDISDGMEPERLAFVINTYLSEMSNIAIEYGGTIDKFIGDAILVFFGDPESEGERNDALNCAKMALRMRRRVQELQKVWQSRGISKPLKVRMGINTGFCTVGNFGSDLRLDYTVLGGPVNLAARLQAMAAPDTILISESTQMLLQDVAEVSHLEDITPKGFARPVGVYRLEKLKEIDLASTPVTHVGRHVEVSIPDRRKIREAIVELKSIQEELEQRLRLAP